MFLLPLPRAQDARPIRPTIVSHVLAELDVGFEEIDDGLWTVYFGMLTLGWFHEDDGQIEDHQGRRYRHNRC